MCKFIPEPCPQPLSAVPSLPSFLSPSLLCELLNSSAKQKGSLIHTSGEPCSHPGWLLDPREAPARAPMVSEPLTRGRPVSPPHPPEAAPSVGRWWVRSAERDLRLCLHKGESYLFSWTPWAATRIPDPGGLCRAECP